MNYRMPGLASAVLLSLLALLLQSTFDPAFASEQKEQSDEDSSAQIKEVDGILVLDDLVVSRKGELTGVTYEKDGTISVTSSSLFNIYEALNSGFGAAVNFNVSFSKNSTVMNADGEHELDKMGKALTYMDDGSKFELVVKKGSSQPSSSKRRDLEESRVLEILAKLRQRYKIEHAITVKYVPSQKRPTDAEFKAKSYQTLAMTIVNIHEY